MKISHAAGSYQVSFCEPTQALLEPPEDCVVVTDENVLGAWPSLFTGRKVVTVPAGEQSKSMACYQQVVEEMLSHRANRGTTVIALGGGVVGDLAGFVAATYMRGLPLIQVPTSLLAQVDASVGGKVGIDLPVGKNLVGSFYAPKAVRIGIEFLSTLPKRQFDNGAAEIWKYAFIADTPLRDWIRSDPVTIDRNDLADIVRECIDIKRRIVEADEHETTGTRAILNFGHTVGHAIERLENYSGHLHGEAIAIGMMIEARLGEELGVTAAGTAEAVERGLQSQSLPTSLPKGLEPELLLDAMRTDKKVDRSGLGFALLERIGACKLVQGVDPQTVLSALKAQ